MRKTRLQIFDIYSDSFGIHIWMISENGNRKSIFRRFKPYFFLKSQKSEKAIELLRRRFKNRISIKKTVKKDLLDGETEVYQITANTPVTYLKAVSFIRKNRIVEEVEFYNIQLTPAQIFMYEKKIFPFCIVEPVTRNGTVLYKKVDKIDNTDYQVFDLRVMKIKPDLEGENPKYLKYLPPLSIEFEEGQSIIIDDENISYLSHLLKKKILTYS
ncbi:hypothetical protein [Persephonella sp.]